MGTSLITTIGSLIAGGTVAAVTIVGVVNSQTGADGASPTDVTQPVSIDYGTNG